MARIQRPHLSDALRQLRGWVTIACAVVAICALGQVLVFAFVHSTEVTTTHLKPKVEDAAPLRIVDRGAAERTRASSSASETAPQSRIQRPVESAERRTAAGTALDPNAGQSAAGVSLRRFAGLCATAGVIGVVALAAIAMLAVCVAGGGGVPGVERVVTSGVWSLVLALLCLPWRDLFPGVLLPGVFVSFDAIADISSRGDTFGVFVRMVAAPLLVAGAAAVIVYWFRTGVEMGIIANTPSEADEAISRELATIRTRGVVSASTKAGGALTRVLAPDAGDALPHLRAAAGAESMSRPNRGMGEPSAGDGLRRPI